MIEINITGSPFMFRYLGSEPFDLYNSETSVFQVDGAPFINKITTINNGKVLAWDYTRHAAGGFKRRLNTLKKLENNKIYQIYVADPQLIPRVWLTLDVQETGVIVDKQITGSPHVKMVKFPADQPGSLKIDPEYFESIGKTKSTSPFSSLQYITPTGSSKSWTASRRFPSLKTIETDKTFIFYSPVENLPYDVGIDYTDYDNDGVEASVDLDDNDPNVTDGRSPTITLVGDNPLQVIQGTSYEEPGWNVTDPEDDAASLTVETFGELNMNIPGQYTLKYVVTDTSGMTGEVTRVVVVAASDVTLTLIGEETVTHNIGDNYVDAGATATRGVEDISDKIQVDITPVDFNTVGEYTITYKIKAGADPDTAEPIYITRTRTVVVTDKIVLIAQGMSTPVGAAGCTIIGPAGLKISFDRVDITSISPPDSKEVTLQTPGDDVPQYLVIEYGLDLQGKPFVVTYNSTEYEYTFTTNQVIQTLNTPPTLTLVNGDLTITTDQQFEEPGASAIDDEDGVLQVSIDGTVDDNTPGEYVITYSVTDSAGATVEKQRTVTVIKDTDGDGESDDTDPDIDGDNIPNEADIDPTTANDPNNPNPTAGDTDGDGYKDTHDPDIDGDNIPNEADADPNVAHDPDNPNPTEDDTDGDGIKNAADADPETPYDPNNATTTTDDADGDGVKNQFDDDIDGDGTSNAEDDDVDGDGITNEQDADPNTPVDPDNPVKTADDVDGDGTKNEFDDDIDGDGDTNDVDDDDDGDGINDVADADHPDNADKPDSDDDGIIDEYDSDATGDDIDGDGIPNDQDTDHGAAGKSDLDGDSWADEYDDDIDGDGITNDQDTITRALDPNKDYGPTGDIDGDGVENQEDTDDDNDGIPDIADADHPDNQNTADHDGDGIIDAADANHPDNIDKKNSDSGSENPDDLIDSYDPDMDGDEILNEDDPDMDGDGIANEKDIDTPGNEDKGDIDGDNIIDEADPDMDGDGKMNNVDDDIDGDQVLNEYDGDYNPEIVDNNNDNIDDRVQTEFNPGVPDIDGDGIIPLGDVNDDGDEMDDDVDPNDDNDNIPDLYDMDHPDNQSDPDAKDEDGDGVRDDAPADVIDNANNDDIDDDGISNSEDDDIDGDNVLNIFDGDYNPNITDTNGNNIDDSIEKALNPGGTDSDDDGILDHGDSDMDGDGVESQLDDDDDGDDIPDTQDASHPDNADKKNSDNDDIIDEFDTDDDNDDIPDTQDDDIDGDGVKNELDADHTDKPDTDDDGIIDEAQPQFNPGAKDTDGDNIIDTFDDDIDGDGVDNVDDDDIDGDGVTNEQDADPSTPVDPQNPVKTPDDVDGDGTKNEFDDDIDGDGFPNDMDDDDDGDGTPDIADGDHPDNADKPDVDDDGIVDEYDTDVGNDGTIDPGKSDSDGDGVDDTVDNDDDNDGLADEVDRDADGDGIDDFYQTDDPELDSNGDGLKDSYQDYVNADPKRQQDADGDGIQDFFDNDDDNDGVPDQLDNDDDGDGIDDIFDADHRDNQDPDLQNDPLAGDLNNDGVVDKYDAETTGKTDTDSDGLPDIYDSDDDNDGTPDIYDADDDGDGIDDVDEVDTPAETAFVKFKMIDNDTGSYTNDMATIIDPEGEATSLGNGWYEVPSGDGKFAIFESTMFKSAEWEDMENPGVLDTYIYSNETDAENYYNWISNEPLARTFVSPPGSYQYYVDTNNEYIRYVINVQSFATSNWWMVESFLVMKNQAPTIDAVLGDDPLLVNQYSTSWTDPGVTVSDPNPVDNPSVSVSHEIDFSVPGDYTVTYTADDGRGGVSSPAYRVVRVVPSAAPPANYTINVKYNYIVTAGSTVAANSYLTTGNWSDHPSLTNTKTRILSYSSGATLSNTLYNGSLIGYSNVLDGFKMKGWQVTDSQGSSFLVSANNDTDRSLTNKGSITTGQVTTLSTGQQVDWTGQTITLEPVLEPVPGEWWYARFDTSGQQHAVLVEFPGVTNQGLNFSHVLEPFPTSYTDGVDSVPDGEIIRFKKAWLADFNPTFKDGTTSWQGAGNIKVYGWNGGRWVDLIGESKITPTWTDDSVEWVWTEFPIQHVYIWQNV